jgi:hypothetical protein
MPLNARYGVVGPVPRHIGAKLVAWRIRATKPKITALPMAYSVLGHEATKDFLYNSYHRNGEYTIEI